MFTFVSPPSGRQPFQDGGDHPLGICRVPSAHVVPGTEQGLQESGGPVK